MLSSPPPSAGVTSPSVPSASAAQYAGSRHAARPGAAAIITAQVGRVLLVLPTYRQGDQWLPSGGGVEPGEHPHAACRREITEELGLEEPALAGVLAVHSLSPHPLTSGTARPSPERSGFSAVTHQGEDGLDGGSKPCQRRLVLYLRGVQPPSRVRAPTTRGRATAVGATTAGHSLDIARPQETSER
ncbi:NUDIX domain-containing protein [Streptomyces sp. NPDC002853]